MKTNSALTFLKKSSCAFGLVWLLGTAPSCTVSETANGTEKNKTRQVKIYPDIIKKTMHVKNAENAVVDFFVFDAQGTLMIHYKMNEGGHKKINGLEKGTYTYQVFKKDEMSETGKLMIK